MLKLSPWGKKAICWVLVLWGTVGSGMPVMGQQGFVHRFGALYRLALVDDGSPISLELVGETGIDGRVVSMGYGKDEQIYAAEYNFPPRLWAIDPETAEAELIGELSHIPAGDMTFDEEGRLWLFGILGTLFLVDTQTATMSEVATVVETAWGLAYFEGQLYSLIPTSTVEDWSLVSIDQQSFEKRPIPALELWTLVAIADRQGILFEETDHVG